MNNEILMKKQFYSFEAGYRELKYGNLLCLVKIDRNFSLEITESVFNQNLPDEFKSKLHVYMESNDNNQNSFTIQNEIVNSIKNVTFKYLNMYKSYNESGFPVVFENSNFKTDQASLTTYMAPGRREPFNIAT